MSLKITQILQEAFAHFEAAALPWDRLAPLTQLIRYTKNEIIKPAHTQERSLYYIIEGSGGVFSLKCNKMVCLELCYEKEFFGDYSSLLLGVPSPLETQVLEYSYLLKIPFQALQTFYEQQGSLLKEKIGRMAAEYLYIAKQQQLLDLQTLTAEERYCQLLVRQPQVLQRTPVKYIASYLGITPESLSRIRRNQQKNTR